MSTQPLYLDYAATTPVHATVLEKMLPFFSEHFGNSSSATHQHGWYANGAIKKARKQIAQSINCEESEIIFTSGATESINIAAKGIFELYQGKGKHIVVAKTEHKAVLDTIKHLENRGAQVTYLEVDKNGTVTQEALQAAILPTTILIAVMWINNETGVIQNAKALSDIAYQNNIPFLCDGTQALGKVAIDMQDNTIGAMALSAHKIFGPKGVGALYIRRKKPRIALEALIHGGGQEKHLRAGTLNVPGIVGFGYAADLAIEHLEANQKRIQIIKEDFIHFFSEFKAIFNGNENSAHHILNVQIPNLKADQLVKLTRKISYSLGSACTSETLDPSHVLSAMGLSKSECFSSFRLSFSAEISKEEISFAKDIFRVAFQELNITE